MDWKNVRESFPILKKKIGDYPLIYLDSAASSCVAQPVADAIYSYYTNEHSNVHRGAHTLSGQATDKFERSRQIVAEFLGFREESCVFTRGATEALNIVARCYVEPNFCAGDNVVVTRLEHHANLVPWLDLCKRKGGEVRYIELNDDLSLNLSNLDSLIDGNTKLVSIPHISNVVGIENDIDSIIAKTRLKGVPICIDACQGVAHAKGAYSQADFVAFSGHKICGPTGVGALLVSSKYHSVIKPYFHGGNMISTVSYDRFEIDSFPHNLEAGTPPIAQVIGLGTAIEFLSQLTIEEIHRRESHLIEILENELKSVNDVIVLGSGKRNSIVSFAVKGKHHNDIGTLLDTYGVAIRTGHHCAEPLVKLLNFDGVCRFSLAFYNTEEEIVQATKYLKAVLKML